jgi:hypothetical protein
MFYLFLFFKDYVCKGGGPRSNIPFPPDLILYVNLVAKGVPFLLHISA